MLSWLAPALGFLGLGANYVTGRNSLRAQENMLKMEQDRMSQLYAEENKMRGLEQDALNNYHNLDAKIGQEESRINREYEDSISPFRDRRQRQLNDPAGYYAEQAANAMSHPDFGGQARNASAIMQHYNRGLPSSADQRMVTRAVDDMAKRATLGYDAFTYNRDKDAQEALAREHSARLERIDKPRSDMLTRLGMQNILSDRTMASLNRHYDRESGLNREKFENQAARDNLFPQLLSGAFGMGSSYLANMGDREMQDLQKQNLQSIINYRNSNAKKRGRRNIIPAL